MRLSSHHIKRVLNASLRLATLATKMGLTLYMGRYLSLEDLGLYGVVNGTVIILMTALGLRLDYVVSRDLVGASPKEALLKMRDQAVFCTINYSILAAAIAILAATDVSGVGSKILFFIFALSVLENFAAMTFSNQVAMGHPMQANVLFFIRSGLWVFPVVGLGLVTPAMRTSGVIFSAWAIGILVCLVATAWAWRGMPWGSLFKNPIDWKWLKKSVRRSFFIWLGSVGTTAGFFVDRFVIAHNLNLELAGVITFYASFTGALFALVDSGVISFAYPRLIALHKAGNHQGFKKEMRHLALQVAVTSVVLALIMGATVPLFGSYLKGSIFQEHASTFWLMLLGICIREMAQTLYYILFARHQDRAIWLGDLLFLVPAFGCNVVLVPMIGFAGVGYSSVIAQSFILLWRIWHVKYGHGHRAGGPDPGQPQTI